MKKTFILACIAAMVAFIACKETKKSTDIIVKKEVKKEPSAPIRMQDYNQMTEADLGDSHLTCQIHRTPDDSLSMVKDETGQLFVDNVISIVITRGDGSTFYRHKFTKASFDSCLDDDYRKTGILEGLVFDRVEGQTLRFAASVSHPGTDEYIPIVLTIDRFGNTSIKRDTQLDTNAEEE
ncbi:MAG: DUF4738 domain-containing protein [Prevotella sp.]